MAVYVVYGSTADEEAAKIIAEAFGYTLDYIQYNMQDPLTQHTEDDIVVVGAFHPDVFYRYYWFGKVEPDYDYFASIWYDSILNPKNYPNNPEIWQISQKFNFGVSPDGRRHIQTIIRKNGTKVTVVCGINGVDTLEAAKRFSKGKLSLTWAVVFWALAADIPATILWK
jgi:hypothetical protein